MPKVTSIVTNDPRSHSAAGRLEIAVERLINNFAIALDTSPEKAIFILEAEINRMKRKFKTDD